MIKSLLLISTLQLTLFELQGQIAVISNDYINVLYVGVENPLTVAVEKMSCNDFYLETDNNEINGSDCKYTIKPNYPGKIIINIKSIDDSTTIDTITFMAKRIPSPEVGLGRRGHANYFYFNGPEIEFQECYDFKFSAIIEDFHFEMIRDSITIFSVYNNGAVYNDEIKKVLKREMIKPGDIVLLKDVHIKFFNDDYIVPSVAWKFY